MTPFNHDLDQNDLIAYHLQELSPRRERALRRILQEDAALAAESDAIAATLRAFPKQELSPAIDAAVLERNWLALLPSLVVHFPQARTPRSLFRKHHLLVYAGTAFAAVALVVSLNHHQHERRSALTTAQTLSSAKDSSPRLPTLPTSPADTTTALSSGSNLYAIKQIPRLTHRPSPSASPFAAGLPDKLYLSDSSQTSQNATPPVPLAPTNSITLPPSPALSPSTVASIATPTALPSPTAPLLSATRNRLLQNHHPHPADFTLAMFGNFAVSPSTSSTSGTGTSLVTTSLSQTATNAVGALASFHQQFSPWLGYRITTTYSRPNFTYTNGEQVNDRIYELSGTYAVQGPHHGRLTTSFEAGASLLAFLSTDPGQTIPYNSHAIRPAAVLGVGSELALTHHWSVRAEYRTQLYKPPPYNDSNTGRFTPAAGNLTLSSNPTLGITYHFGTKGNE